MKVKIFFGSALPPRNGEQPQIEKAINEWLEQNSNIKVIDIKFTMTTIHSPAVRTDCGALVMYE